MTVGNERRECLLNKLLRWYNAFNRITRSFDWNFRFCSYLCSVLKMGASMRITTAYLNSSQVDAMQPRQPATQYEHKKSTFYTILLQSNAFVYALSLVWFSRFHHIIEFWAVSCSFFFCARFVLFLVDEIQWSFQGKLNCSSAGGLNHFTTLSNLFISLDINAAKMTFFRSATWTNIQVQMHVIVLFKCRFYAHFWL